MLNVKILLGSTRQNRTSEKLVPWITETLAVLDLRDHQLPFFESAMPPSLIKDGNYGNEAVNAWAAKIKEADAFIIVAPEYNHGYTAVLKNAIDVIYGEWNKKAVAFISYGSASGVRAVEQLRQVAVELQMASTRQSVQIAAPWALLDESGAVKAGALDSYTQALKDTAAQLNWWGEALKAAREKSA
jgi:NAD(P)H-dependent FMN reductase